MKRLLFLPLLSFVTLAHAQSVPLDNPGFEQSLSGWIVQEKDAAQSMISVTADAAHEGQLGLRVDDQDQKLGSSVASQPVPIVAGQTYRVSFFARTRKGGKGGVYLRFSDAHRAVIEPNKLPMVAISKGGGQWEPCSLETRAPEGAANLAVWIHTWSGAVGVIDFDDFTVEQVEATTASHPMPGAVLSASPRDARKVAPAGSTGE